MSHQPSHTSPRRSHPLLLAALAASVLSSGCSLFGGSGAPNAPPTKNAAPERSNKCEAKAGEEPFLFMPLGRYTGTFDAGKAELDLNEDNKFFLDWESVTEKGQWTGEFTWTKEGIGEAFNFCNVQPIIDGKVRPAFTFASSAVMGIDKERNAFDVTVDPIGKVRFVKKTP